jgi:hypothetical protein
LHSHWINERAMKRATFTITSLLTNGGWATWNTHKKEKNKRNTVKQSRCSQTIVQLRTHHNKRVEHSGTRWNTVEHSRCEQKGWWGYVLVYRDSVEESWRGVICLLQLRGALAPLIAKAPNDRDCCVRKQLACSCNQRSAPLEIPGTVAVVVRSASVYLHWPSLNQEPQAHHVSESEQSQQGQPLSLNSH